MGRPEKRLRLLSAQRGVYEVESTDPDQVAPTRVYNVDPNGLRCDCRAGTLGRACRHLHFVLAHLVA